MQQAIVAAEDNRFYQHHGVDPKGVARAFVANARSGGVSQGASTLTMQYVRDGLRDSASTPKEVQEATEQTSLRKVKEMRMALDIEKELSKEQILERYLNSAYFGHRAYGIYAAAQIYFSKTPDNLTPAEAAMLAGLVKSPSDVRPGHLGPEGRHRAAQLRARPHDPPRLHLARRRRRRPRPTPIRLQLTNPPNDCASIDRQAQRLGLLLRLCSRTGGARSRRSARPGGADGQPAPRRLPDRRFARPEDPGRGRERTSAAKERTGSPFATGSWSPSRAPAGSRRWR